MDRGNLTQAGWQRLAERRGHMVQRLDWTWRGVVSPSAWLGFRPQHKSALEPFDYVEKLLRKIFLDAPSDLRGYFPIVCFGDPTRYASHGISIPAK